MTTRAGSLLAALRIRPVTERRILAGAAYAASAALVLAIWVNSLRSTLRDAPTSGFPALGEAALNSSAPPAPSAVNQPSPFALLGDAVRALAGSLTATAGRLEQAAKTEGEARGAETTGPAAPMGTQAALDLRQDVQPRDRSQPPLAPGRQEAERPAALVQGLAPKSYPSHATARLLAIPINLPVRAHRNDATGRLGAVVDYNLMQLRQAARDAYHSFAP